MASGLSPTTSSGPPLVSGSSSCPYPPVSKNPCRLSPIHTHPGECSLWSLGQSLPAVCSLGGRRWVELIREVNVVYRHGFQPPASESVMNLCSKPDPSPYLLSAASPLIAEPQISDHVHTYPRCTYQKFWPKEHSFRRSDSRVCTCRVPAPKLLDCWGSALLAAFRVSSVSGWETCTPISCCYLW